MRRVVVTGIGLVTPLAVGRNGTWRRLLEGCSGVDKVRGFDASGLPNQVAGEVPRTGSQIYERSYELEEHEKFDAGAVLGTSQAEALKTPGFISYAIAAAKEALDDAKWAPDTPETCNATGVSIGVGMGSLPAIVDASNTIAASPGGYRKVSPFFVPRILTNLAAGQVSIRNQLKVSTGNHQRFATWSQCADWSKCEWREVKSTQVIAKRLSRKSLILTDAGYSSSSATLTKGPVLCPTTACAAGAHAVGDALRIIQDGDAEVMVAGGSESAIDKLSFVGFSRARALSTSFNDQPTAASRPFDRRRDGFVMSEGAGALVLEELEHALSRSAPIYAEILSCGMSGDAHHITGPLPNGDGARRAMAAALRKANAAPEAVDYVNAHATSTPLGDLAENTAIQELLGRDVLVSSTKSAVGHLLGAAGAVEAAFTALAIRDSKVPPTLNLDEPDEGFELDYVPMKCRETAIDYAMSNSFGFGGTNASLLFRKYT